MRSWLATPVTVRDHRAVAARRRRWAAGPEPSWPEGRRERGRRSGRRTGSRRGRCPPARGSRASRRRRTRPTSPTAYRPGTGSVGLQHPAGQVGLQAAEGLAGEHVQPHGDQRTAVPGRPSQAARSSISCGSATRISRSPKYFRAAAAATTCGSLPRPLRTCRSRGSIISSTASASIRCSPTSAFILAASSPTVAGGQEVDALVQEGLHLRRGSAAGPAASSRRSLPVKSGFCSEPDRPNSWPRSRCPARTRSGAPVGGDMSQRAQRVEPGKQRGGEPLGRTRPATARTGQAGSGCRGAPHRRVVDDPLRVVPHPVRVDHPAADPLGHLEHRPVHVVRHAGDISPAARPSRPASSDEPARCSRRSPRRRPPRPAPRSRIPRRRPPGAYAARRSPRPNTFPRHPYAVAATAIAVTRCRPGSGPPRDCSTASANGWTRAGPVPQMRWKRGTVLPWPGAG